MANPNRKVRYYLRQARDREQEAEGLLARAMKLTEEATQFRAKADAIVRELAAASDSGCSIDESD